MKPFSTRHLISRLLQAGLLGLSVLSSSGCQFLSGFRSPVQPNAPVVFQTAPSLDEIVAHTNNNSAKVQQLRTESAQIIIPGAPTLQADITLERPHRFRLQGYLTRLTGTELDMGSNEELFWLWVKRQPPPTIYYAHRDRFAQSQVRSMLPIEPDWLINALGIVTFDPADRHEGPYERGENQWEVITHLSGEQQGMKMSTLVDGSYGWVTAQHVYDPRGQLIASAKASDHKLYSGVVLPSKVDISLPTASLNFQLLVMHYGVNQQVGNPAQQWAMPQEPGVATFDITAGPMPGMIAPGAAPGATAPGAIAPTTPTSQPFTPGGFAPMGSNPAPSAVGPPATAPQATPDAYSPGGYQPGGYAPGGYPTTASPGGYAPEGASYPRTGFRPSYRGVTSLR